MIALIGSLVSRLVKGQSTNSTAAAFSVNDTKSTTTEPAASATRTVITTKGSPIKEGVTLKVTPYGGDTNNDKIEIKVIGWNSSPVTGATATQYVSHTVCEVEATLTSALPGIAAGPVVATEFFSDGLSLTKGFAVLHTGTDDIDTAWFECDVSSYEYVEILYAKGAGGDQINCLYRF